MLSKLRFGPLFAVLLLAAPGCLGGQSPAEFPFWLPSGPIVRTHAKPPGIGNFADFDTHAVRLEIRPLVSTNPTRTQHLVVATVLDEKNQPRRKRRVEWILEGVGSIVEVDESGYLPGRGYKVDNRYAVSFTDMFEHTITRGNGNPTDDFTIGPGQSWCIISSPVEGDSHLTVYAPEIHDFDKREVVATIHWVDAQWQFPTATTARSGGQHTLTTNLYRHTDRTPLPGYRVRYTVLDGGPPVVLLPNRTREVIVNSNDTGAASADFAQLGLQPGVNRIGVEVIRPPDPANPHSPPIVLAKSETTIDWQGPQLNVSLSAPVSAVVDQEIPTTITVTNPGKIDTKDGNVYLEIPPGMAYVRSDPPAKEDKGYLVWSLESLGGGRQQAITATFRAKQTGTFATVARAVTRDDIKAENNINFRVEVAQLKVTVDQPKTSVIVGEPFTLPIAISNPEGGTATNVTLEVRMEDGLEAMLPNGVAKSLVSNKLAKLEGKETRTFGLRMVARKGGTLQVNVRVEAEGGMRDAKSVDINVQQAQLSLRRAGPGRIFLNKEGSWSIAVRNTGEVALPNAFLRERLPPELTVRGVLDNGQLNQQTNEIGWNLGTLAAGEERVLRYSAYGNRPTTRGILLATATAYPSVEQKLENSVEVLGVPALRVELTSDSNPIQVGQTINYTVRVLNQGTLPADGIEVSATFPADTLQILAARGPQNGRIDRDKISFPAVNGLPPNQTASFQITARALKEGDARFRVTTAGISSPTPLVEEEATRILPPMNGGGPGGPIR